MQPRLRIDHRQGSAGVPGCIPNQLFPALALDIGWGEELESRTARFKKGSECRETGFLEVAVDRAVGIQADL